MWLWILGGYEIVRTMVQAEKCFSPEALNRLRSLKKSLAIARMPASKMEKQGKRVPVTSIEVQLAGMSKIKTYW